MTSLEPAVAAILALLFLGEVLSMTQCLAIALIMAASMGCAVTTGASSATARVTSKAAN